jgi:hypothetical protein
VPALFYGWGAEAPSAPTRTREKIIGEETCDYAQRYTIPKKSSAIKTSYLRFGRRRSTLVI